VAALIKSAEGLGVTALVIAPVGGVLKAGRRKITVDRTLATARSIEFDALVVAGGTTPSHDIKLIVLLQEAFRHCKAPSAWGMAPKSGRRHVFRSVTPAWRYPRASIKPLPRSWRRR